MTINDVKDLINKEISKYNIILYQNANDFIAKMKTVGKTVDTAVSLLLVWEEIRDPLLKQMKAAGQTTWLNNPLGKLWETVKGFFQAMFASVWDGFTVVIPTAINEFFNNVVGKIFKPNPQDFLKFLQNMQRLGYIDSNDAEHISTVLSDYPDWQYLGQIFIMVSLVTNWLGLTSEAVGGTTRKKMYAQYSPNSPDPMAIIRGLFIAPEMSDRITKSMSESGLSKEDIDLLLLANYQVYSVDQIRTLYLRKEMNEDEMYQHMRKLGYTDTRIANIVKTWYVIPGAGDLFSLVSREAFEPDAIRKLGLGDEFPESQVASLEANGITREWALKYWYAHWQQPGIQQGFDMLHRGEIDLDILNELFKTVEIPPFWREKLTNIAYHPYTRVDAKRMHALGVLDDTKLYWAYRDLGYDDEKAQNMTVWAILDNQETTKDLTKSEILTGYKDDIIPRNKAANMLFEIGYDQEESEYYLTKIEADKAKELQKEAIETIREAYIGIFADRQTTLQQLNGLNLKGSQIQNLMTKWDLEIERGKQHPTKADVANFFVAGIIKPEKYKEYMRKLKYSEADIQIYLEYLITKIPGETDE